MTERSNDFPVGPAIPSAGGSLLEKPTGKPKRRPLTMAEKLQNYIPEPNSGCWLWAGMLQKNGYPRVSTGKSRYGLAHRAARAVLAGEHKREPSRIKSRGFDKTRTRTFGGKVVAR